MIVWKLQSLVKRDQSELIKGEKKREGSTVAVDPARVPIALSIIVIYFERKLEQFFQLINCPRSIEILRWQGLLAGNEENEVARIPSQWLDNGLHVSSCHLDFHNHHVACCNIFLPSHLLSVANFSIRRATFFQATLFALSSRLVATVLHASLSDANLSPRNFPPLILPLRVPSIASKFLIFDQENFICAALFVDEERVFKSGWCAGGLEASLFNIRTFRLEFLPKRV